MQLKLGATLLNLASVVLWCVWGAEALPPYNSPAGAVLLIHVLAGCLFALPTLLLAQTLGNHALHRLPLLVVFTLSVATADTALPQPVCMCPGDWLEEQIEEGTRRCVSSS